MYYSITCTTASPAPQYHMYYSINLHYSITCTTVPHVLQHHLHHSTTCTTAPPALQHKPAPYSTTCTTALPTPQHHLHYRTTYTTASPAPKHQLHHSITYTTASPALRTMTWAINIYLDKNTMITQRGICASHKDSFLSYICLGLTASCITPHAHAEITHLPRRLYIQPCVIAVAYSVTALAKEWHHTS